MPHFVPNLDHVVFNVSGQTCRVWGIGYSSLVLEMPLALCHGREGLVLRGNSIKHHKAVHVSLQVVLESVDRRVQSNMTTLTSWDARQGHTEGNIFGIVLIGQS